MANLYEFCPRGEDGDFIRFDLDDPRERTRITTIVIRNSPAYESEDKFLGGGLHG